MALLSLNFNNYVGPKICEPALLLPSGLGLLFCIKPGRPWELQQLTNHRSAQEATNAWQSGWALAPVWPGAGDLVAQVSLTPRLPGSAQLL